MVIVNEVGAYFGHVETKVLALAIDSVRNGKNLRLISDGEWEANKDNREKRKTCFGGMGEKLN